MYACAHFIQYEFVTFHPPFHFRFKFIVMNEIVISSFFFCIWIVCRVIIEAISYQIFQKLGVRLKLLFNIDCMKHNLSGIVPQRRTITVSMLAETTFCLEYLHFQPNHWCQRENLKFFMFYSFTFLCFIHSVLSSKMIAVKVTITKQVQNNRLQKFHITTTITTKNILQTFSTFDQNSTVFAILKQSLLRLSFAVIAQILVE